MRRSKRSALDPYAHVRRWPVPRVLFWSAMAWAAGVIAISQVVEVPREAYAYLHLVGGYLFGRSMQRDADEEEAARWRQGDA